MKCPDESGIWSSLTTQRRQRFSGGVVTDIPPPATEERERARNSGALLGPSWRDDPNRDPKALPGAIREG